MKEYKKNTRILFTGQYSPGTNSLYISQAFQRCGAIVRFLDDTTIFPYWRTDRGRILRRMLIPTIQYEWNKRLIHESIVFKPDLIYITDGHMLYPETILQLQQHDIPIMCFYHDVHWRDRKYSRFDRSVHLFNLVVTTRCWHEQEFKDAGAKNVMVVRFGYHPQTHHPISVEKHIKLKYSSDVCFIGTKELQRVKDLEYMLHKNITYDFKLWGGLWDSLPTSSPILRYWQGTPVFDEEIPIIYALNKVALHWVGWDPDGNNEQLRKGDQHNSRTFQIPACNGAMMLAQRTEEHRSFFEEDKEAVFFDTPDELLEKLAYWLAPEHDQERVKVAQAAYDRCLKEDYSYVPVVKRFLEYFNLP